MLTLDNMFKLPVSSFAYKKQISEVFQSHDINTSDGPLAHIANTYSVIQEVYATKNFQTQYQSRFLIVNFQSLLSMNFSSFVIPWDLKVTVSRLCARASVIWFFFKRQWNCHIGATRPPSEPHRRRRFVVYTLK